MKCPHCNNELIEVPLCYGIEAPDYFYKVPEEQRTELIRDFCVIDEQFFYIRGHIEIPIINSNEKFIWSVWVSLSGENFLKSNELLNVQGRENEQPYFGWLSTELSIYPISTLSLKTMVHTQEVGAVPLIELEQTDHPLAVEQREGITMERVIEIAHLTNHHMND
ncbi:hypothetical protein BK120_23865 [Paenibacillus sp. FSL A5-0031]|uniref:DUF2199 domain-containing protein n=1 Tax=Paenibacillus sp. FSL A5-0031 TaxID=1920420 RepID=UPI00096EA05E|nr:DUF2199 domain-containing protein [Paenibacillus sp. FSL A5-0031]OME78209.1 hypothetical protein BK120_23865 [Paenibacillus sp. FSL A5-0031]